MSKSKGFKYYKGRAGAVKAIGLRKELQKTRCKVSRKQRGILIHKRIAFLGVATKKPIDYIEKLYCISEDLYSRDIVETNHAVNSGTTSIKELKMKYAKYVK